MSRTLQKVACSTCRISATPPPFLHGYKGSCQSFLESNARSTSPPSTPISGVRLIIAHASTPPSQSKMAQRVLTCEGKM